jgi:SAM-dependent methyltransferase
MRRRPSVSHLPRDDRFTAASSRGNGTLAAMSAPDAAYFDQWYTDMASSPAYEDIVQRTLGLPPELRSSSLLTWDGIAEAIAELNLTAGDTLLDAACGRGGYGLEIGRRTGARVIGIDFSAVAIGQARRQSAAAGLAEVSDFRVGDLVATGLPDRSVDAIICVDALAFADPPVDALRECLRVLTPGGRLALTGWQAVDPADERLSLRLRQLDLAADMVTAGFAEVRILDKPDWLHAERSMWQEALAADAGNDQTLRDLQDEAARTLDSYGARRRVLASGTAPS